MVRLYRDGKLVKKFKSYGDAVGYVHRNHSYSFDHAIRYEGYSIKSGRKKK